MGPIGMDRSSSQKGLAILPLESQDQGKESHETTQRDRGLQPGSREPQETGAQLDASAEPITGPAFIICQATPWRPAAGPKGLRPPSHVRTILFPYLSFWASFQAWRKTAASKGEEVSEGEERKRTVPLSQGRLPG